MGFWRVAFRMLWRHRLYSVLNIFGLAVGLTAAMLILLQVAYEKSYDSGFANADRIYRIARTNYMPGQPLFPVTSTAMPLGAALDDYFEAEVETVVRTGWTAAIIRKDGIPQREFALLTDPGYFQLFERPVIAGDPVAALSVPSQAVLTRTGARRYFGDADPMGRVLELTNGPALTVAAVVEDPPRNASVPRADLITSLETPFAFLARSSTDWGHGWLNLFVMLRPGVDMATVEARLPDFLEATVPNFVQPGGDRYSYWLRPVPLRNSYLGPWPDQKTSAREGLNQITLLAGLLVLIAVVNFTNLATARSGLRAREVALRKTLGAPRGALIRQFMAESLLIAGLAGMVTLALVELLQPAFAAYIDRSMDPSHFTLPAQLGFLVPLVLVAGLLGGVWPGIVLSGFKPAIVFRGAASATGGGRLRQVLVVAQFAAAIAFGIAAWVMFAQFQHGSTQRLGFDKDNVVLWRGLDQVRDHDRLQTLAARFRADPEVTGAALAAWVPGDNSDRSSTMRVPEDPAGTQQTIRVEPADYGYLQAMGATLLAGRLPDPDRADDMLVDRLNGEPRKSANVVVSAELVRFLAFGTPDEALGRTLVVGGGEGAVTLSIVGVVADFQFQSAQQSPSPTVFAVDRGYVSTLVVRMREGAGPADLNRLDALWHELLPDQPVVRDFLDDRIRAVHNRENLYGRLFGLLAFLAILIANIGLFGLAAFTADRRTKEIGVRKILGARTSQILRLLVWQFSRPVALAWVIAVPLAWFGLDRWLSVYANRIDLTPLPFVVAGAVALAVAWVTVAGQAARVARRRPVTALRYE